MLLRIAFVAIAVVSLNTSVAEAQTSPPLTASQCRRLHIDFARTNGQHGSFVRRCQSLGKAASDVRTSIEKTVSRYEKRLLEAEANYLAKTKKLNRSHAMAFEKSKAAVFSPLRRYCGEKVYGQHNSIDYDALASSSLTLDELLNQFQCTLSQAGMEAVTKGINRLKSTVGNAARGQRAIESYHLKVTRRLVAQLSSLQAKQKKQLDGFRSAASRTAGSLASLRTKALKIKEAANGCCVPGNGTSCAMNVPAPRSCEV